MRVRLISNLIRYTVCMVSAASLLWPGIVTGQSLPTLVITDASVFEGNSGTKILSLPVSFVGAQNNTVTGVVSAIPLTGTGFNAATGGSSCGGRT